MADTTAAGRHRTALALRKLEELDYEATGQLPAAYRPKRRRRLPPVFMATLVELMSARPAPERRPRRRVTQVVETERSGCGFCQNKLVQAVAVIAIAWFAAIGWVNQDFVQDHLTGHQGVSGYE